MQHLDLETLAHVTGGAISSQRSSSLSAITSQISDLKYANNSSSNTNLLLPIMFMALNRRQNASTVVSTPGATVIAGY